MVRRLAAAAIVTALVLGAPGPAPADHVSISASTAGQQVAVGTQSVKVRVTWSATCHGATSGAFWSGNLSLDDPEGSGSIYMGGVSSGSGSSDQLVERLEGTRSVTPVLRLSCANNADLHGSESVVVRGNSVEIPGREDGGSTGDGDGGGGSTSGGGGGGTGPERSPSGLPAGACAVEQVGTPSADSLLGTRAHDRLLGRGGDDRLLGRDGHDCLHGGPGRDRLTGGAGRDALHGGSGGDRLTGGPGRNRYDAGPGPDAVDARNGRAETVRCGSGRDRAFVDRADRARGCERVIR